MFTKRQHMILSIIVNQMKGIKGTILAQTIGVTDRTIRSDVVAINRTLKSYQCLICSSQQIGYYIDIENRNTVLELLNNENIEADNDDRLFEILGYMFFEMDNLTIEDLADEIFVSEQTIALDINRIQKMLLIDYSLDMFDVKRNKLYMKATELEIRILFAKLTKKEIIFSQVEQPKRLKLLMKDYFVEEDFKKLLKIIMIYYQTNGITLSSDSLYMLSWVLYFVITRNDMKLFMNEEYDLATKNNFMLKTTEFLKNEGYHLNSYDQKFLINFMSTLGVIESNKNILIMSENTKAIVSEFGEDIKNKYGLDIFHDYELAENIILHIDIMIHRLKENLPLTNPILSEVKLKYPYSYEIAMLSVPTIFKYENKYLNDDEISYLAIYIQSYIESAKIKQKVAIVSGSGLGLTKLIQQWVEKNFVDLLEVISCVPSYEVQKSHIIENCDVIISSVFLDNVSKPIIYIKGIPDSRDKENIYRFIKKINTERHLVKIIENTFDKKLFKCFQYQIGFEDVIRELSHLLYKEDCIVNEKEFAKNVIEREVLYPTKICEGFMIPHPLQESAKKNSVAVGILNKGLTSDPDIKIIFLLALNSHTNQGIDVLFQIISLLTSNYQNIIALSKSHQNNLITNLIGIVERNE